MRALQYQCRGIAPAHGDNTAKFQLKIKQESFTGSDLEHPAETVGCSFERQFILPDGDKGLTGGFVYGSAAF